MSMTQMKKIPGALGNSLKIANLPAVEYFGDIEVQSCSQLKAMLQSPAHYQTQFTQAAASSKSKDFGSLLHLLVLEPHLLPLEYAVFPGRIETKRDPAYKEFARLHAGKTVIDEVQLHEARTLADRLLHRLIRRGANDTGRPFGDFLREGEREVTIYYTDPTTEVRCRVRIDLLHPEVVFDLKTAESAKKSNWMRNALAYHYDMQAYMYSLAASLHSGADTALPFVFVVGESTVPYSTSVFAAGETFMREGSVKYARALGAYAACAKIDLWPDQGEDDVLELEPWMATAKDVPGWQALLGA